MNQDDVNTALNVTNLVPFHRLEKIVLKRTSKERSRGRLFFSSYVHSVIEVIIAGRLFLGVKAPCYYEDSLKSKGVANKSSTPIKEEAIVASGEAKGDKPVWDSPILYPPPLCAPSPPILDNSSPQSLSISWRTPSSGQEVLGYTLQVDDSENGWTDVYKGTVPHTQLSNLKPSTTYYLRVRAESTQGHGDWSITSVMETDPDISFVFDSNAFCIGRN